MYNLEKIITTENRGFLVFKIVLKTLYFQAYEVPEDVTLEDIKVFAERLSVQKILPIT